MRDIPLSLYVHFPWCVRKCPYCDFNSHELRKELPESEYIDALLDNLRQQLALSPGRPVESVFMGGGTPSLVSPAGISTLLGELRDSGRMSPEAEITLEANPGATDESHYAGYLSAGVNRLSIGVQSFNDELLRDIGRIHSADQALRAIRAAKRAGFSRINLDLMYGLPGQTAELAGADIQLALEQDVEHLSVYQLTIEANTEFAVRPPALPASESAWNMQQQAGELMEKAGYQQYEVSAWSRDKYCAHNLNYWQFGDYLAIGAGAHGKLSRMSADGRLLVSRHWNYRHPKQYLAARSTGYFVAENHLIPEHEMIFEFLMNALRVRSGFSLSEFVKRTRVEPAVLLEKLEPAFIRDWLVRHGDIIRASETGYRFLDSVLLEYI